VSDNQKKNIKSNLMKTLSNIIHRYKKTPWATHRKKSKPYRFVRCVPTEVARKLCLLISMVSEGKTKNYVPSALPKTAFMVVDLTAFLFLGSIR